MKYILLLFGTFLSCTFLNITCIESLQPMKILYVVDKFPYYTKTVILNQIISLLELGHDVYIYASKGNKSDKLDPEIFKYNILERTYHHCMPPDLNTYDVIAFQYGDLGKSFAKLKKVCKLKAKLVTCFRGGDITKDAMINGIYYQELFDTCDLFLPICEYFKYKLVSLGCDSKKIFVSYSPINCERFSYQERSVYEEQNIRIVSVHRLHESKGTEFVIAAIRNLVKEYPGIEYLVAGDGPEREHLENLIKRYGLTNNVKLLGWRSQEEVAQLLSTAHLFILFSVTSREGTQEAIPNAIKEAMLMGLPVISTYHGGIGELVKNGYNGFLVPERDYSTLTDILSYLFKHRTIWPLIGKRGRESVRQKFDMWRLGAKLEHVLYTCLGRQATT